MRLFGLILVVATSAFAVGPLHAASPDLQGAEAILQKLPPADSGANPLLTAPGDNSAKLSADIDKYKAEVAALKPHDAAIQWVALAVRCASLSRNSQFEYRQRGALAGLVAALPPPAAWQEISALLDSRAKSTPGQPARMTVLKLIGHMLANNVAAQRSDLTTLKGLLGTSDDNGYMMTVRTISDALIATSGDPATVTRAFKEKLSAPATLTQQGFVVPDLVTIVGPASAASLIKQALLTPNIVIASVSGDRTKKLVRSIALENAPQLKEAQWALIERDTPPALYEAMAKRFPGGFAADSGPRSTAAMFYLAQLISAGRIADSVSLASQILSAPSGSSSFSELDTASVAGDGHSAELYSFIVALMAKKQNDALWPTYLEAARHVGKSDIAIAKIRTLIGKPSVTALRRQQLRDYLCQELLAGDRVEEAVAILRTQLDQPTSPESSPYGRYRVGNAYDAGSPDVQLAKIGKLENKPDWLSLGLTHAIKRVSQGSDESPDATQVAQILRDVGRGADAESLLGRNLVTGVALQNRPESQQSSLMIMMEQERMPRARGHRQYYPTGNSTSELACLAGIYQDANRPKDVLLLLDRFPYWMVPDLAYVLSSSDDRGNTIGAMAAKALADLGRTSEAISVAKSDLLETPDDDPAFALLVKLQGVDAIPYFESLFAKDRFEVRPLIWKAVALKAAGKLDQAEATVKHALSTDPTDGQTQYHRRLYAYTVLAEIVEAAGRPGEAAEYRQILSAVRRSELADEFVEVGLIDRAIAMYAQSLQTFGGAYCIQARIALQLTNQGRLADAMPHWKRAYELMPSSFGEVETHCFGCEGMFSTEQATAVAEKVFTDMASHPPVKPQVYYLLGALRKEQGRSSESLAQYRKAVAADPDYLNAWKAIQELSTMTFVPQAVRDETVLAFARLDPTGRHTSGMSGATASPEIVWKATEIANAAQPPLPVNVYPLPASADWITKLKAKYEKMLTDQMKLYGEDHFGEIDTPGAAVASQQYIAQLITLFDQMGTL
ncbi:MAG TPA: hypothetical protein VGK19_11845 [Capsulimonadaceae bacterium]|jgi:tetratricopeptide (TPR) repeat protein